MYCHSTKPLLLSKLLILAILSSPSLSAAQEAHEAKPQAPIVKAKTLPAPAPIAHDKAVLPSTTPKTPSLSTKPKSLSKPPLPTTKPKPTTAAIDTKKFYLVKPGESLYSISVNTKQVFQNLAQWNQLPSPYHVRPGQTLKLFNPLEVQEPQITPITPAPTVNAIEQKSAIKTQKILPTVKNLTAPKKTTTQIQSVKKTTIPNVSDKPKAGIGIPIKKVTGNSEKKSAVPIINKKMVKLNFQWPTSGKVIKGFHQTNNQGIDIENKPGTQLVQAAEAGQVVYTGSGLNSLKNLVIIKHDQQFLTAYANNSRVLVKEEQQVKAGQVIAEISSATQKPNPLHFQIRKNGAPVNPLDLLPK